MKTALCIILIVCSTVLIAQDKLKTPKVSKAISKDLVMIRARNIQREIAKENLFVQQLVDPIRRAQMIDSCVTKLRELQANLDGLVTTALDSTLLMPEKK
jgi:hypothetical protein